MLIELAGGVGGAKLAAGFARLLGERFTAVVNTGDDFEHLGLSISPDLDTVMYGIAGINNPETGWGVEGETWAFMEMLERLGGETWFRLGDRDLAVHVERTRRLRAGEALSAVTAVLCERLGIRSRIVPMSVDPVRTVVVTDEGELAFQDYFVRRHCEPRITGIRFEGAERSSPSTAFLAALEDPALEAIVIGPSNPILSVRPILAVPGVEARLRARRVPAVAVSPIIGGKALKGPAAKILLELGIEPSALAVAQGYRGLIDGFVMDRVDQGLATQVRNLGVTPLVADTVMRNAGDAAVLARLIIDFLATLRPRNVPAPGA